MPQAAPIAPDLAAGLATFGGWVKRWFNDGGYLPIAMSPAFHLLGPILLMLPAAAVLDAPEPARSMENADSAGLTLRSAPVSRPAGADLPMPQAFDGWSAPTAEQVRIEQRVTIRITPRPAPMPMAEAMFDQQRSDEGGGGTRFTERKMGKCLPVAGIAGVQPASPDKLLLIMRDQRLVTAQLGKGCRSRDYYSGFLVAKNADGQICTGRDALLSRSGANCQVHTFRQLIPAGN